MKRASAVIEAVFDLAYLLSALTLALILLFTVNGNPARLLAGIMGLVLVAGDACHLLPRVVLARTGREADLLSALGLGKQAASITMTLFYLVLWRIGLTLFSPAGIRPWTLAVYGLALIRIILCLLPQNEWRQADPPVSWGVVRNIPFFLQGMLTAGLFFIHGKAQPGLELMWLAIVLSFAFYLPVVFWARKIPALGMLMLPKTMTYLWILVMCLSL